MKTSLTADLRRGDETQVLLKLQTDGVLPDDYSAIASNDALRADIVAAILKHRLFAAPTEQIARILTINEMVWKDRTVTEKAIKERGDPPDCPPTDERHLNCVVLLSETGDALKTFERNWAAAVHIFGSEKTWKWDGLVFTPNGVKPRPGAMPRQHGLRWAIAELGRGYQNQSVENVRNDLDQKQIMGMGQEAPLIAALHTKWAMSMNGTTIPYLDCPDLMVSPGARDGFVSAPILDWHGRLELGSGGIQGSGPVYGSGSLR